MKTVTSKDGTSIAFDQAGSGPALILVTGALGTRAHADESQLVDLLAKDFTVYNYDRRGRGDSGDTVPYAPLREIEDIEAVIDAAGGTASLYGISSGAMLALNAASKLPVKVKKVAMYEPPLILDDSRPPVPSNYVEHLNALTAAGKRGEAVTYFMTAALLIPEEFVEQMRNMPPMPSSEGAMKPPEWSAMEKVAPTLAYDGEIVLDYMQGKPLPGGEWNTATMPVLVIAGGNSEPFFHTGAQALADDLPNATYRVLEGQDHAVAPAALAPVIAAFLLG